MTKQRHDYNKPNSIILDPPNPKAEAAARRVVAKQPDAELLLEMLGLREVDAEHNHDSIGVYGNCPACGTVPK